MTKQRKRVLQYKIINLLNNSKTLLFYLHQNAQQLACRVYDFEPRCNDRQSARFPLRTMQIRNKVAKKCLLYALAHQPIALSRPIQSALSARRKEELMGDVAALFQGPLVASPVLGDDVVRFPGPHNKQLSNAFCEDGAKTRSLLIAGVYRVRFEQSAHGIVLNPLQLHRLSTLNWLADPSTAPTQTIITQMVIFLRTHILQSLLRLRKFRDVIYMRRLMISQSSNARFKSAHPILIYCTPRKTFCWEHQMTRLIEILHIRYDSITGCTRKARPKHASCL